MAYTKTNWEDLPSTDTPIIADNLQNMEDGIEEAHNLIDGFIEQGSNENGSFIKFANGTMICTKNVSSRTTFDLWANNIFFADITNGLWAQEFTELWNIQATNGTSAVWVNIYNYSTTSAGTSRISRPDNGGSSGQNYNINILAIGKWK